MGSRVCMNGLCGATSAAEWKRGWPLRSGEFASLCDKCGSAYEQLVYCDTFHSKDTGWRDCTSCGKSLHCGCIASSPLLELLDSGGVKCIGCIKSSGFQPTSNDKPKGLSIPTTNNEGEMMLTSVYNQVEGGKVEKLNLELVDSNEECNGLKNLLSSHKNDANGGQVKEEEVLPPLGEVGNMSSSNFNLASVGSSENARVEMSMGIKDAYESLAQTNLTIALASPSGNPNSFRGAFIEEREMAKTISSSQQVSRSRHLLPKPPKSMLAAGLETSAGMTPQIRVARPPVEGRVKNQLLPRYWPRITDQELQQISGDSNSTIVPLFEKVLSASDAGRIGRLVLPKACAEAYFPPISQPEGLPLKIQDVKGKEWVFQFRFWPNNNSRMYVLEGVTPCIQSMQLQAGDTVTFSRMDPEGKLIMGFRKASNTIAIQAINPSAILNGALSTESLSFWWYRESNRGIENLTIMSGYSGLLQSLKGSTDPNLNALAKHLNLAGQDFGWNIMEKHGSQTKDGLLNSSLLVPERKKSRNIGLKSKRLLIDSQDALELKLTWEEAQDMLQPPLSEKPTIVTVEDLEFEEYEEPPVFGKRSIFIARLSGCQEQWTQCDGCSKWRRLPADILLPPKWTCLDNIWDESRSSCSAPDELNPKELENLLRLNKDFKRRRMVMSHRPGQGHEPAGLDTLANAAVLGDSTMDPSPASVATTTKHPRHRPGCSCIVCIQPPSGKGKHKPTCTCNVCMTVKRRFKTLMMRKKKRQSEREAEIAQRNHFMWGTKDETEVDSTFRQAPLQGDASEGRDLLYNELQFRGQSSNLSHKLTETGKGQLDLNSDPEHSHSHTPQAPTRVSMMSLLQVASLPLETYLKQNGLTSLIYEQQGSSGSQSLPQATGESDGRPHEDHCVAPVVNEQQQESRGEDELAAAVAAQSPNDPS